MKACILAAGEGKRLSPITDNRPKHMIRVAGKPLLEHTIERLKINGITEILIVVGFKKEQIMDYFKDGTGLNVKISYIEQTQFLGTANAAYYAKDFAKNDPFMLIYGDLLVDTQIFAKCIERYNKKDTDAVISLFEVPDPQKYGIINLDSQGFVKKIVEKPETNEYGNLANAGVYIFSSKIFEGIEKTPKSKRGEYEITDSMQILVDNGYKIAGVNVTGLYWSDVGHPWQLLEANQYLMGFIKRDISKDAMIEDFVVIKGEVIIEKGSVIKSGSYIEGPAIIGENSILGPQCYIRPYTSIGPNCHIGNSTEVKASIILENTYAAHLSYIGDSVIGANVNIGAGTKFANVRLDKKEIAMMIKGQRVNTMRKKLGGVVGDHASIGINVSVMPGKKIGIGKFVMSGTVVDKDIE
jgi:UDP-N-acetylglucosamine diphosphorylase/glucosamine-1-phosphate N-acetyltransferase